MESISVTQWVLIGLAGLLLLSGSQTVKSIVSGVWGRITSIGSTTIHATHSDEANVAAFKTIRHRLPSDLAKRVRDAIQPDDSDES